MKKTFLGILTALFIFSSFSLPVSASSFTDIGGTYAKPFIEVLTKEKIISGYTDGTYRPQDKVTRAQFSKMLALALKLPTNPQSAKGFTDVKDWADPYVGALVDAKVTKGIRPDFFGADNPITRQEMIVMFIRAMGMEQFAFYTNLLSGFNDEPQISQFAYIHVAFAEHIGFAEGNKNNFMPTKTADRAAAAKWIYNFTIEEDKYFQNSIDVIVDNTVTLDEVTSVQVNGDAVQVHFSDGTTKDREIVEFFQELLIRLNYEYLYFMDGLFWNELDSNPQAEIIQVAVNFWGSEYSDYTLVTPPEEAVASIQAYLNRYYSDNSNTDYTILDEMLLFAEEEGIIIAK